VTRIKYQWLDVKVIITLSAIGPQPLIVLPFITRSCSVDVAILILTLIKALNIL